MTIHLCFLGFVRNSKFKYNINPDNFNINFYLPSKKFEDKDEDININEIKNKVSKNINIKLYDYDRQYFIEILKDNNIKWENREDLPKSCVNPNRTLSFFNNIKNVLEMIDSEDPNDVIILTRVDVDINRINIKKIQQILNRHDIIVEIIRDKSKCKDRFFIFKNKNRRHFISLFESSINMFKGIYDENNNSKKDLSFNAPERLLFTHFKNNKLRIIQNQDVFKYKFYKYYRSSQKIKL